MTSQRTLPQSFVGGELSALMAGRPDDPKYQHGGRRIRNHYVKPSGAAPNRPGTAYLGDQRNHDHRSRLIRFNLARGKSIQVAFGFRQEYPGSSTVPGWVRFLANGGVQLFAVAWSAATAYVVGDQVLQAGQLYRCRLAHTNQSPPNATFWETLEYVPNRTFNAAAAAPPLSGITTGAPGVIYFGAGNNHNLENDEPIEFTGDAGTTAPAGITYGVVYYAEVVDPERIRVRATPGGPALAITTVGAGAGHRMHRRYFDGELTSHLGSVFYCRTTRPIDGAGLSILPSSGNETFWYQEPATGELEIPTTLALSGEGLFGMTYSQQGAVLTVTSSELSSGPWELRRQGDYTWTWALVTFAPSVAAPTNVVATATKRGATLQVVSIAPSPQGSINTTTEHRLVPGLAFVYIDGTIRADVNGKYWGVEEGVNDSNFKLVNPETGAYLDTTAGASGASGGTVRETRLHADESNSYVVTAIGQDGRESQKSSVATVVSNLLVTGAYNDITWTAVPNALRYRVYKQIRATQLFGLLGESTATTFRDDASFAPSLNTTPPELDTSLSGTAGNVPQAVGHHEGRRGFAGTLNAPQDVWLVRTNTEADLSFGLPLKATDRIHQQLKGRFGFQVMHLISASRLIALTDTSEFRIGPIDSEALTPESFAGAAQTYVGAAAVQPVVMENAVLFVGSAGGHVYQMGWRDDVGGFLTLDLCERAAHLFDGRTIVQMAEQTAPEKINWCVTSDGKMLGLTYVPSQQVFAWHWHDTDGTIETVSVGRENGEDRVYLGVARTINGVTRRTFERLGSLGPVAWVDNWFVDCGLRLETSTAVTTISNLGHLEGKTVAVFANGLVQAPRTVVGGQITLATPLLAGSNKVLVGLPITAELQTMPAAFALEAYGTSRPKSISKVHVLVDGSGTFEIGPSLSDMVQPDTIAAGAPFSGLVEVRVPNEWTDTGQVFIRQTDPLPLTVVSITAEMAVGG